MKKHISSDNFDNIHPYKNGFLISFDKNLDQIKSLGWKLSEIEFHGVHLSIHYDKKVNFIFNSNKFGCLLILGNILDQNIGLMNSKITSEKLLDLLGSEDFYSYSNSLNGRYLIIYSTTPKEIWMMQDATGMRSVFYEQKTHSFSTHYNLLAEVCGSKKDNELINHLSKFGYDKNYLPGNRTPYKDILQLTPNIEINLINLKRRRFFPRSPHNILDIDCAATLISERLKTQVDILSKSGKKIYISLTAGLDSKLTLASFYGKTQSANFFTYNKINLADPLLAGNNRDVRIARKIAEIFNLDHSIINVDGKNKLEKKIFDVISKNHYAIHFPELIQAAYSFFEEDAIHIRSTLAEIMRRFYAYKSMLDDHSLQSIVSIIYDKRASDDPYILKCFEDFMEDSFYEDIFNYDIFDLLYWEYRIGTWHAGSVLLESDLLFETYALLNTREILNTGLSIPRQARQHSKLQKKIIDILWHELNSYIPNSDYEISDYFLDYQASFGIDVNKSELYAYNIFNPMANVRHYSEVGIKSYMFGFYENKNNPGDCLSWSIEVQKPIDIGVLFQISWIFKTYGDIPNNSVLMDFFVNGNLIKELKPNRFADRLDSLDILIPSYTNKIKLNVVIKILNGVLTTRNQFLPFYLIIDKLHMTRFSGGNDIVSISKSDGVFNLLKNEV